MGKAHSSVHAMAVQCEIQGECERMRGKRDTSVKVNKLRTSWLVGLKTLTQYLHTLGHQTNKVKERVTTGLWCKLITAKRLHLSQPSCGNDKEKLNKGEG